MASTSNLNRFLVCFLLYTTSFARHTNQAGQGSQAALVDYNAAPVTKVTVEGNTDLSVAAEVARVDIAFSNSGPSYEMVADDVTLSMRYMQGIIKELPAYSDAISEIERNTVAIIETTSFPPTRAGTSYRRMESQDDIAWAHGFISVRVSNVNAVRHLVRQAARDQFAEIEWIGWDLTEDTRASMTSSLRSTAMQNAVRNADGWAKVLAKPNSKLVVTEIVDDMMQRGSNSPDEDWRPILSADESATYHAPNVTVHKTVRCTFELH